MRRVYKYGLRIDDDVVLTLPRGAEILHVDVQARYTVTVEGSPTIAHEDAFVWALVDPAADTVERQFRLAGTGHDLPDDGLAHVGSFMMAGGGLVFHLFEVT